MSFQVDLLFHIVGIHLRKESDKHQKPACLPSTSTTKRKLRKRRAHVIRSASSVADPVAVARQLARSQTEAIPPSPVRSKALSNN